MARTFDIRFARSAGLAALLEAPENRFRWKGVGLLRIDAQSISFTVKRGVLALFAGNRTRRIPAGNLKAVYREGDALRVEFQADEAAREVLPFWARDRKAAAEIVRLLPTSQTVEIEHSTHSGKPRLDRRILLLSGAVLATVIVASWAVYERAPSPLTAASLPEAGRAVADAPMTSPTPDASTSRAETPATLSSTIRGTPGVEAPAFPLNGASQQSTTRPASLEAGGSSAPSAKAESATPSMTTPSAAAGPDIPPARRVRATPDGIVPIVPGMPAYHAAWRQLDLFIAESDVLLAYYMDARYSGNSQRLTDIAELWWKVTVRVHNSRDFDDPSLRHLQEIELAVSRAWRRAISMRSDPALLAVADAEVEFAEMLRARARQFVE